MFHSWLERHTVTYIAALALALSAPATALQAAETAASMPPGVISITFTQGNAWVDDAVLASGANLYAGERVRLDREANAMLHVPGGFALAAAGSSFVIEPHGLRLERGRLQLRQDVSAQFMIENNLFRARLSAAPNSPTRAEFLATDSGGRVTSLAGVVELTPTSDATATYRIHPGESALLGDQVTQAATANTSAGAVTRMIPQVEVDRGTQQLAAAVQSPVFWNDLLHSGRKGRARVNLNDGSLLSLGSDSSLRVLQHDAAAQQTVLDLAVGRMRGQVIKITRPGGKFEVRTPSAVAGLVGTDFYLYATPDFTELIVFDGIVRMTNLANGQSIDVGAGMKIIMRRLGQTEGPSSTTAKEIAQAQSLTNVPAVLQAQRGFGNEAGILIVAAEATTVAILTIELPNTPPVSPVTPGPGSRSGN